MAEPVVLNRTTDLCPLAWNPTEGGSFWWLLSPLNITLDCSCLLPWLQLQRRTQSKAQSRSWYSRILSRPPRQNWRKRFPRPGRPVELRVPEETPARAGPLSQNAAPFYRSFVRRSRIGFSFSKCTLLFLYVLLCWDVSKEKILCN